MGARGRVGSSRGRVWWRTEEHEKGSGQQSRREEREKQSRREVREVQNKREGRVKQRRRDGREKQSRREVRKLQNTREGRVKQSRREEGHSTVTAEQEIGEGASEQKRV